MLNIRSACNKGMTKDTCCTRHNVFLFIVLLVQSMAPLQLITNYDRCCTLRSGNHNFKHTYDKTKLESQT